MNENKEMFLEEFKAEVLTPKEPSIKIYEIVDNDDLSMVAESNV